MTAAENLAVAALGVAAVALAIVAVRAWLHARNTKVLLLALAFALFLAKSAVFAYALFTTPDWAQRTAVPGLVLDVVALGLLYSAVLTPGPR